MDCSFWTFVKSVLVFLLVALTGLADGTQSVTCPVSNEERSPFVAHCSLGNTQEVRDLLEADDIVEPGDTPKGRWQPVNYGLGKSAGRVSAFGDYDSDKYVDIFHLNKTSIVVSKWDGEKEKFVVSTAVDTPALTESLIVTDINRDGNLDVIAVCVNWSDSEVRYSLTSFLQINQSLVGAWNSTTDSAVHPFVVDINGDGYPDLIAEELASQDEHGRRFVWLNAGNVKDKSDKPEQRGGEGAFVSKYWEEVIHLRNASRHNPRLRSPHSSAFVDVNGDCKADIVLDTVNSEGVRTLEIWLAEHEEEPFLYLLDTQSKVQLPKGSGQFVFADFNADGTNDFTFGACELTACSVKQSGSFLQNLFHWWKGGTQEARKHECCKPGTSRIFASFNVQYNICTTSWGKAPEGAAERCIPEDRLCTASPYYLPSFMTENGDVVEEDGAKPLTITKIDGDFVFDRNGIMNLRVGDYNSDGYNDILALVDRGEGKVVARLFENVPPKKPANPHPQDIPEYLTKSVQWPRSFVRSQDFRFGRDSATVYDVSFFDVMEDGVLEVMLFGAEGTEGNVTFVTRVYLLAADFDMFFLKATALNGVSTSAAAGERKPYGVNYHGPTFKITVTDLNGIKSPRIGTQLAHSAYTPLSLPFVSFGLGRTNNYVEEFFLGVPVTGSSFTKKWIAMIPNTQVIALPYPLTVPNEWELELSVSPSKKVVFILGATLVCLVVVGAIIWVLDRQEKAEDLREQEQRFRVHFIAA